MGMKAHPGHELDTKTNGHSRDVFSVSGPLMFPLIAPVFPAALRTEFPMAIGSVRNPSQINRIPVSQRLHGSVIFVDFRSPADMPFQSLLRFRNEKCVVVG